MLTKVEVQKLLDKAISDHDLVIYQKMAQAISDLESILNKHAFDHVHSDQFFDLASLYQILLNQHQLASFEVKNRFYEVGSFFGIKELENFLKEQSKEYL